MTKTLILIWNTKPRISVMNRIKKLFAEKQEDVLNIYFTAGFPELHDTGTIIKTLDSAGVDLIELGMPYSDPLADGETIQRSSSIALKNGLQLDLLFDQVTETRKETEVPIMLMGYYNQIIQYGQDTFLDKCVSAGIDGLIIPDIPMDYYEEKVAKAIEDRGLSMTFLVTPETSDARIKQADALSSGFLYVVAQSSITGGTSDISDQQEAYFERLNKLDLQAPRLIGFGIHNKETFAKAAKKANGAIIGSAFIRMLEKDGIQGINNFVKSIKD